MGSLATPYLQVVKGSRNLLFKFWDPFISRELLELKTSNFAESRRRKTAILLEVILSLRLTHSRVTSKQFKLQDIAILLHFTIE